MATRFGKRPGGNGNAAFPLERSGACGPASYYDACAQLNPCVQAAENSSVRKLCTACGQRGCAREFARQRGGGSAQRHDGGALGAGCAFLEAFYRLSGLYGGGAHGVLGDRCQVGRHFCLSAFVRPRFTVV